MIHPKRLEPGIPKLRHPGFSIFISRRYYQSESNQSCPITKLHDITLIDGS